VKLGLGAKLFLSSLGLVSIPTAIFFTYARADIEKKTIDNIEANLHQRVKLGLITSSEWPKAEPGTEAWQRLTAKLSRASGARVTVIRRDGRVLGDSNVEQAQLAGVDNHLLRPEIQSALSTGLGIGRRHSRTTKHDLLYVAMPFGPAEHPEGVLRMALDLGAVDREVEALQRGVGVGALIALILSLVAAGGTAMWASRGARQLTDAARRMSEGDLDFAVPVVAPEELGELGRTLGQLARSLSSTLEQLRSERDWMGGILSRMREGVILLDAKQCIKMLNPALREMLLLSEEVVGKPVLEAIRHGELKRLLDRVFEEGKPASREIEISGLKPRQLLVRAAPLGTDGAVFAVMFDVTEIRRLESLRKDFVANVSHELRTPVTAIRSAAETLRDVALNDAKALPSFADIIARNAERLGCMVDDLLELSRIESREIKLVVQAIDLGDLISQVLALFHERALKRRQSFEVVVPEDLPWVMGDRHALDHILTNLVDNAVKYSGERSVIRVQATPHGENVVVRIEDTGPGIAEEHLSRLFERFYRVDIGRSREQGGTGLGLSIVKHLVEAMGSQISVESTVGVGTRFSFALPKASREIIVNCGMKSLPTTTA
jgi:two-component system, OmpR family, phosphate regulon sensor histidine kinase PhoR